MKDLKKYEGVIVPMVSPLREDFSVDEEAVSKIVDSFIANKVMPFVLGTTGEAASLSPGQREDLVRTTAEEVKGRVPLLAGIGSNSVFVSIDEGKKYADMGVDALVALIPNYYPSGDKETLNLFTKLADNVPVPVFLYNIPATTHHSLSLDVIERLSHHPNIIGIKDSEQNKERLQQSLDRWKDREDFLFLVGWAAQSVFGLQNGADGIVPSVANLIPDLYFKLYDSMKKGDLENAEKYQEITNVVSAYCQAGRNISQSIPALKVLMSIKGLCGTQVLPPMMRMEPAEEAAYIAEMKDKILKPLP